MRHQLFEYISDWYLGRAQVKESPPRLPAILPNDFSLEIGPARLSKLPGWALIFGGLVIGPNLYLSHTAIASCLAIGLPLLGVGVVFLWFATLEHPPLYRLSAEGITLYDQGLHIPWKYIRGVRYLRQPLSGPAKERWVEGITLILRSGPEFPPLANVQDYRVKLRYLTDPPYEVLREYGNRRMAGTFPHVWTCEGVKFFSACVALMLTAITFVVFHAAPLVPLLMLLTGIGFGVFGFVNAVARFHILLTYTYDRA
jgi:hypothetical protein